MRSPVSLFTAVAWRKRSEAIEIDAAQAEKKGRAFNKIDRVAPILQISNKPTPVTQPLVFSDHEAPNQQVVDIVSRGQACRVSPSATCFRTATLGHLYGTGP